MHHELPARLDLEHYRKQAKSLVRDHAAGEREARGRAAEMLGPRADDRFLLSDAQHVIARSQPRRERQLDAQPVTRNFEPLDVRERVIAGAAPENIEKEEHA